MSKNKNKRLPHISLSQSFETNACMPSGVSQKDESAQADFYSQAPSFVMEEYKRLCAEIDYCLKESTNCVNYSIAATAAFWAWLMTAPSWIARTPILLIPLVLTIVWNLRWRTYQNAMTGIGGYLKKSESLFLRNTHGWETHLSKDGNRKIVSAKGRWVAGYFSILVVANLLIGGVVFFYAPTEDNRHSKAVSKAAELLISALTDHVANPDEEPSKGLPTEQASPK